MKKYKGREQLNNGAKVLDREGDLYLCEWDGEYVTWMVDVNGDAYWGHYFRDDITAAVKNFHARADELRA